MINKSGLAELRLQEEDLKAQLTEVLFELKHYSNIYQKLQNLRGALQKDYIDLQLLRFEAEKMITKVPPRVAKAAKDKRQGFEKLLKLLKSDPGLLQELRDQID